MKGRQALDDLDGDIHDHLERETADNIARGMARGEARDAARRKFGNIALAKEDARAVWIPIWFDQLLVGAGLMVRSFWRMTTYPPGFTPERVLTMRVQFSGPRYRDTANRRAYIDELLSRAGRAPGVEAAGVNASSGRILLFVEGAPEMPRELMPNARIGVTSASYAVRSACASSKAAGCGTTSRVPFM